MSLSNFAILLLFPFLLRWEVLYMLSCISWGNWYIKIIILDIKSYFTCDLSKLHRNRVNCQIIMGKIVDQDLSSILSRWPNHCGPLSCKHFLILFNFSLVLSSFKIISSDLTLHIHLTTLALFLSSLITSSSLTDQVVNSLIPCTHAEHDLVFAPQGKPLLVNNKTKSLDDGLLKIRPYMSYFCKNYKRPVFWLVLLSKGQNYGNLSVKVVKIITY